MIPIRRFADPAFREHPGYRRAMQAYLAWRDAVLGLLEELDLDSKSRERGRFALTLLTEAIAPTNALVGNPAAVKRAFETGGRSLWRGLRHFASDCARERGGMPSQVGRDAFRVGVDLAVTRGGRAAHRRRRLLQYAPTTADCSRTAAPHVPPQINKYYISDLGLGRLIEYAANPGFTVFVVSWRNPTPAQRDWVGHVRRRAARGRERRA